MHLPEKESKQSLYQIYASVERQTGKRHPLLDSVKIPEGFAYLWEIYFSLRRGEAIPWVAIQAYSQVTGVSLSFFDVDTIIQMDATMEQVLSRRIQQ